jgi:hypothetical protein
VKFLPPAAQTLVHPAPIDRGTTFFALPTGAILETHGDLSQSEAAARWDLQEAARRAKYDRDRAAWLESPPETDLVLAAARAAERTRWTARHDAKWNAKEERLRAKRQREREEWARRRAAKGRRRKNKAGAAAAKSAWLARQAAKWTKRMKALRAARAAERTRWTARHDAKWEPREATARGRLEKKRAVWFARMAEPPIPGDDENPHIARRQWRTRRAWVKRRDRLLAPFRPRPFQAVIADAEAVPAIALCEIDCALPHLHTDRRKRRPRRRAQCEEPDQQRLRFYGRRKRGAPKAKSSAAKRLNKAEKVELMRLPVWDDRPLQRGDCRKGPRPCPWVGCRQHLYLDVKGRSIKINFPHMDVVDALVAMPETCSLDVADRAQRRERQTQLEDVGTFMNVTMERARQVEIDGLASLKEALIGEDIDLYEDAEDKRVVDESDEDESGY